MAGTRERPVSEATMRRLELATGGVAGAGVAEMSARLPWFSRLTADQRAGVLMVTQLGAANFVTWLRDPDGHPPAHRRGLPQRPARPRPPDDAAPDRRARPHRHRGVRGPHPRARRQPHRACRAGGRRPALRPRGRVRRGDGLRVGGRVARRLGRAAGGPRRRRDRPRRPGLRGRAALPRLRPRAGIPRHGRSPSSGTRPRRATAPTRCTPCAARPTGRGCRCCWAPTGPTW